MKENVPPNNIEHTIPEENYPTLLRRFQASFIDRLITYTLIGIFLSGAIRINNDSLALKVVAILMALSYEPLMVFYARTVGQVVMGIKVKTLSIDQRVSLVNAYSRFILRNLLGWVSFLAFHRNSQRRALHDLATNTVVVELT